MGVIQIRRAQEKLQNLGNVRMVDTSGLAKSSAAGLETIGKSVAGLGRDIVAGMNSINALIERDHERQANEAVLKFRQTLDDLTTNAGREGADGKKVNEGLFVKISNDVDAAKRFSTDMEKAVRDAETVAGCDKFSGDVRRRFDEKTFSYLQGKWNEGNRLATARWEKSCQESANAGLSNATYDATINPTEDAVHALDNALESAREANHWTDETFTLEMRKTIQLVGSGIIDNQIATCVTDEDYAALAKDIAERNFSSVPETARKFLNALSPETLKKASEAVQSKRYRAATIRNETFSNKVAEVTNLVLDGKINSDSVDKEIGALRTAGAPEKMLTPLLRTRDTLFDSECEQKARDVWMAIEQTEAQDNWAKAVNARVSALPEKVKSNPEFIKRIDAYKKYGREVVDATETARISEQADMILYGEDLMVTSISDREQLLRELSAMNPKYYPPEKMRTDLKYLESMKKENRGKLISSVSNFMKDVVGDTSIAANDVFFSDLTGRYGGKVKDGEAFLRESFSGAEEKDVREAWKQFSEGTSRWLDACDENPTWTDLQRAELYYDTVIQPIFGRLANENLHQDEVTWRLTIQKTNQWLDSLREVGMSKVGEDASYTRYSSDRTKASPSATQKANNPNRKNP